MQRPPDAGSGVLATDAGLADSGSWQDAGPSDATPSDAGQSTYTMDAATHSRDAAVADAGEPRDAAVRHDAGSAHDAGMLQDAGTPHDAGAQGSTDSGSSDAAMSGSVMDCGLVIVGNEYVGDGHFHGTLKVQNTGTTTFAVQTIGLDVPAGSHCDDPQKLPGKNWTLSTTAEHCKYKRYSSTPIAPNATLTFEWSSNNMPTIPYPAAKNVTVDNCQPRY